MTTVWKYGLRPEAVQTIEMPTGAKVVHVAEQYGAMCLWALVDPDAPKRLFTFAICGTGHPAPSPDEAEHVGSVVTMGGDLVWHLFLRRLND